MEAVGVEAEHAGQHAVDAGAVGGEGDELEPVLGERAVGDAAAVDRELLAGVIGDLDAGDVGGRRLGVALQLIGWSSLVRPKTRCCSSTGSASKAARSCTQRMTSTWLPPAPGWSSGMRTAAGASWVIGLAVPSMKPSRSRLSRWTKQSWSVATVATPSSSLTAARACSNTTSRELLLIHIQKSCWVAGAWWPPGRPIGSKGARSGGACSGAIERHSSAPKRDHQVHAAGRDGRCAEAAEGRGGGCEVDVGPKVELDELVGDGALREDPDLRNVHVVVLERQAVGDSARDSERSVAGAGTDASASSSFSR